MADEVSRATDYVNAEFYIMSSDACTERLFTELEAAAERGVRVRVLFDHIGLNKRESKDMVDAFFELIAQRLVDGADVKLSGFGNFQIRTKAPRPGRNPRTGAAIKIKAAKVPKFRPGKALKDALN